ncbi:MT-A70 family methyltransferase [Rhizobium binae]|uniref:MT-A70 family methyltransferase n=1 Tax=Rhizobium binae TaxID=1138190 RepID=UPI001C83DB0B|nr:MT-A70 family methyltransferase [Rhizobium binae]MBX4944618.1 ParB N-terminal domain-containing protein [Rhizobium binae]MBX4980649.1 ParB N-terminal domain-containing protein [Rhizobium binae]
MNAHATSGERAAAILAEAIASGVYISPSIPDRRFCLKLNSRGLLSRDKKDADRWYATEKARTQQATPSDAPPPDPRPEPKETLAERIANGKASSFEAKTGSRDFPVALRIDQIEMANRLRNIDQEKVAALKASIEKIGLRTPIFVYGDWHAIKDRAIRVRLSAGAHRLEAMRQLGHEHIAAILRDEDELDAELWEIDENLIRAELTPADRAIFIHRRKQIYELKFPETAHGGDRKTESSSRRVGDLNEEPKRFTAATAEATGQSERAVQRDAERGEKISEKALRMLRGTRHDKGTVLDRLKTLSDEQQVVYVDALFAADRATEQQSKQIRTDKLATKRTIRTGVINAIAERGKVTAGELPVAAAPIGYVDVPWQQEAWSDETGQDKGLPYPAMSVEELMALCAGAKSPFTPDALLYFWSTTNRLRDAMRIIEAWGFRFVTMITWDKVNIGMGRWVRDRTEHLLICKRGDFPGLDLYADKPESLYSETKTEHSRKPVWFAEMIERLFPDMRKLELFQRKASLADNDVRLNGNWIFWGNQAGERESGAEESKGLLPPTKDELDEYRLLGCIDAGATVKGPAIDELRERYMIFVSNGKIELSFEGSDRLKELEARVKAHSDGDMVRCRKDEP